MRIRTARDPARAGRQNVAVKAAYVERLGEASSILFGELPDPAAGPGQVLVRVEVVAVNAVDTSHTERWLPRMGDGHRTAGPSALTSSVQLEQPILAA